MSRRRVGITCWSRAVPLGELDEPNETVPRAYVRAVAKAGGLAVLLPVLDPSDAPELLASVDAIVISGGGDVDPARYGQPLDPRTLDVDPARDGFELALLHHVLERNTPALVICRGAQILNVALGGSLLQDVDGHRRTTHAVTTDDGRAVKVNSLHHQAIDRLGDGIVVTARAADGIVEAFRVPAAPKVTAVQWHPELLRHEPQQLALFEALR